jgi:hypothetical protein
MAISRRPAGRPRAVNRDVTRGNGYYVWPKAVGDASGVLTLRSRKYMTTDQTDAAIAWIT